MPILEFREAPCYSANLYFRSLICFLKLYKVVISILLFSNRFYPSKLIRNIKKAMVDYATNCCFNISPLLICDY